MLLNIELKNTHWSVGEHHVFEREGFTLCISSQLHTIISKCNTALWWPILETLLLFWRGQMEMQLGSIWLIYVLFLLLHFHCEPQKQYKTIKSLHRLSGNKTMK